MVRQAEKEVEGIAMEYRRALQAENDARTKQRGTVIQAAITQLVAVASDAIESCQEVANGQAASLEAKLEGLSNVFEEWGDKVQQDSERMTAEVQANLRVFDKLKARLDKANKSHLPELRAVDARLTSELVDHTDKVHFLRSPFLLISHTPDR